MSGQSVFFDSRIHQTIDRLSLTGLSLYATLPSTVNTCKYTLATFVVLLLPHIARTACLFVLYDSLLFLASSLLLPLLHYWQVFWKVAHFACASEQCGHLFFVVFL